MAEVKLQIPQGTTGAMAIFLTAFGAFAWGMYQVGQGNKIRRSNRVHLRLLQPSELEVFLPCIRSLTCQRHLFCTQIVLTIGAFIYQIAAFMAEPVMGASGVILPPKTRACPECGLQVSRWD